MRRREFVSKLAVAGVATGSCGLGTAMAAPDRAIVSEVDSVIYSGTQRLVAEDVIAEMERLVVGLDVVRGIKPGDESKKEGSRFFELDGARVFKAVFYVTRLRTKYAIVLWPWGDTCRSIDMRTATELRRICQHSPTSRVYEPIVPRVGLTLTEEVAMQCVEEMCYGVVKCREENNPSQIAKYISGHMVDQCKALIAKNGILA